MILEEEMEAREAVDPVQGDSQGQASNLGQPGSRLSFHHDDSAS